MIKGLKKTLSLFLVVSLFAGIVGILNIDTAYAATKKIHLKKTSITIIVGKTYKQKLINKNGKAISGSSVKWKSKKTSVATITKKGTVKALKTGTVNMTAKYKGKTYSFKVKIKTNSDSAKIKKYVGYAKDYAEYMHSDLANMIYHNFFSWDSAWDSVKRDEAAAAVKNDLKEAKAWLKKAKAISSAKGFTVWDSKIDDLIDDCTDALIMRPNFYSTETLDPYTVKVEKVSNDIKAFYKKVGGN